MGEAQDIGWAVKQLLNGSNVVRRGWNGPGQFLVLQRGDPEKGLLPFVNISTVHHELVPWLCSQTDLLATDWEVVNA